LGFGYRGSGDDAALYRKSLPQYGLYGKLFYNYKNYAGVELLTRFDRTFRYEDEWKMYPSATVFVDFGEIFLHDSKTLSTLRIDGGYGKAGLNRYVPYYMFRKFTSEPVPSYPKEAQTFAEGWQDVECEEFNVGVKAGFLDDRLNLSAVFYSRKSDDLLSLFSFGTLDETDQLWKYTSRAVASEYVDHISNMGVEIDFDGTLISRKNFRWDMGMNFAYNKMSTEFDFPAFMGGLSTTAHFYGVTADLLLDSYRPSRISLGYNIPVSKIKWIDNMSVYATASNIFMRTLVFGIKADF
jgi:iron complex outermembrane receptor protein